MSGVFARHSLFMIIQQELKVALYVQYVVWNIVFVCVYARRSKLWAN
jgi:hypothetical protein